MKNELQKQVDFRTEQIRSLLGKVSGIDNEIERLQRERDELLEKVGELRSERSAIQYTINILED